MAEVWQSSSLATGRAPQSRAGALDAEPDATLHSPPRSEDIGGGSSFVASVDKTTLSSSFVGAHTLLAHDALTGVDVTTDPPPRFTPQAKSVLQFAEASVLPKPPLLAALTESYFQNVFHRYPVVDRAILAAPKCSPLMMQAVCMAGSLMRHSSSTASGLALSHSLYEKTKLMLFLNQEPDPVTNLAALCLMICWSGNPTNSLSLDCPWQWTGTAIRLALQMGLHKEGTYTIRPDSSRLRRIWWVLMVCLTLLQFLVGPVELKAAERR